MSGIESGLSWDQIARELRPYVRRRVGSDTEVDDVLQDILLKMHQGLPKLSDSERFGAWTYRIAHSSVVDHIRAKKRDRLVPDPELADQAEEDPDEENEVASLLAQTLSVFIAELPSPYREAITLTELEGRTQKEAAEMLGVSLSAMKSRVQRGRAKLRDMLEACCEIALDARGGVMSCVPKTAGAHPSDCCD